MRFKNLLVMTTTVFFLAPYVVLFLNIDMSFLIGTEEVLEAIKNSFVQSALSVATTLCIGFLGAMGLMSLQSRRYLKFYKALCLLPAFIPTLFILVSLFNIISPFPFGMEGIVFVHTIIYSGLTSLFLYFVMQRKLRNLAEQSMLDGAGPLQFIFGGALSTIRAELVMFSIFLFVQFFTSFSVPVVVGHQYITMETLIFEKTRSMDSISTAIWISFLESVLILLLILFFNPQVSTKFSDLNKKIHLLSLRCGLFFVVAPVVLVVLGLLPKFTNIIISGELDALGFYEIGFLTLNSVNMALCLAATVFFLACICIYIFPNRFFYLFLSSYVPLSTALIGLSSILLNLFFFLPRLLSITVSLSIIFFPMLFRFQLMERISSLKEQVVQAQLMGASPWHIFKKITFPQLQETLFFLSGLAAFWGIGEFALTGMISGKNETLATTIQGLLNSYRLEDATVLAVYLLGIGLLVFGFLNGLKYVAANTAD